MAFRISCSVTEIISRRNHDMRNSLCVFFGYFQYECPADRRGGNSGLSTPKQFLMTEVNFF